MAEAPREKQKTDATLGPARLGAAHGAGGLVSGGSTQVELREGLQQVTPPSISLSLLHVFLAFGECVSRFLTLLHVFLVFVASVVLLLDHVYCWHFCCLFMC